jgi:membrane protein involved in colicin uptake
LSGRDEQLEARKKQAEEAEQAKKKAEEERQAKARAENCERAKRAKATLDSGIRIATTNAKGEREIMDDSGRAAEAKRLDDLIRTDCAASVN